jgi:hypothetical protein
MTDLDPTPSDLDPTDPQTPDQPTAEVEASADRAGTNRAGRRRAARAGRRDARRTHRQATRPATPRTSPRADHTGGPAALAPQVLVVDEVQALFAAPGAADALDALSGAGPTPGVVPVPAGAVGADETTARPTVAVVRELLADAAARSDALTRSLQPHAGIPALSGKSGPLLRLTIEAALADAQVWVGGAR